MHKYENIIAIESRNMIDIELNDPLDVADLSINRTWIVRAEYYFAQQYKMYSVLYYGTIRI